jgi:hypothetical protein
MRKLLKLNGDRLRNDVIDQCLSPRRGCGVPVLIHPVGQLRRLSTSLDDLAKNAHLKIKILVL